MSRRNCAMLMAGAGIALLLLFAAAVAERAAALLRSGEVLGVGIGAAVCVIPLLTLWFLLREVSQAAAVDRLTQRLGAEGGLEVDDLPRSAAGRIDRAVARDRFEVARAQVEASERDWRAWYRVAWAYDAAGDRRKARACLRHAVTLERAERRA